MRDKIELIIEIICDFVIGIVDFFERLFWNKKKNLTEVDVRAYLYNLGFKRVCSGYTGNMNIHHWEYKEFSYISTDFVPYPGNPKYGWVHLYPELKVEEVGNDKEIRVVNGGTKMYIDNKEEFEKMVDKFIENYENKNKLLIEYKIKHISDGEF